MKNTSRPMHRYDIMTDENVGIVNGLAHQNGGDTLKAEAVVTKGKGNLVLTGQLGDVMKESAQAALSMIRAHVETFGIDYNQLLKTIFISTSRKAPSPRIGLLQALPSAPP